MSAPENCVDAYVTTYHARVQRGALPPSDQGIEGHVPLPPDEWNPVEDRRLTDAEWADQNRKINAMIGRRDA